MKDLLKNRNGFNPYDLNSVSQKFDTKYAYPTNRQSISTGYSLVESADYNTTKSVFPVKDLKKYKIKF